MRLIEKIQKSTSAIERKRLIQENKKSQEEYSKALAALSTAVSSLTNSLDIADEMKSSHLVEAPLLSQETKTELLEYADSCGKGVFEGSLTLDMVNTFKAKGDTYAAQVRVVWKDAASVYSEGPRGYLSIIGGLTDNPHKAAHLAESINKTTNGDPSVASIHKLVADVAEAKTITDAFALSPEIEDFLKKVSLQQATVSDITPKVLSWLKVKKLTSKIKVRF